MKLDFNVDATFDIDQLNTMFRTYFGLNTNYEYVNFVPIFETKTETIDQFRGETISKKVLTGIKFTLKEKQRITSFNTSQFGDH